MKRTDWKYKLLKNIRPIIGDYYYYELITESNNINNLNNYKIKNAAEDVFKELIKEILNDKVEGFDPKNY